MTLETFRRLLAALLDAALAEGWSPNVLHEELVRAELSLRDEVEPVLSEEAPY